MPVHIDSPIVAASVVRDGREVARWEREDRVRHQEEGLECCPECRAQAVVNLDGCLVCLNCGDSRCG